MNTQRLKTHVRSRWPLLIAALAALAAVSACLSPAGTALAAGGQTEEHEMRSGALKRSYRLYVPKGFDSSKPSPLLIALHGGLGTGKTMQSSAGLDDDADRAGMLVAYPDGVGRGWNAGTCCGGPMEKNIDDVLFMRNLVADVSRKYKVDAKRIYGTGFSNGAMMLHRVACEAPEIFTAIAPVSGGMMVKDCAAKAGLPVMMVGGKADERILWKGGTFDGTYRPSMKEMVASFGRRNHCESAEESVEQRGVVDCRQLKGCRGGLAVIWCGLEGVGHQWAGGKTVFPRLLGANTDEFDTSAEVVKFFQAH